MSAYDKEMVSTPGAENTASVVPVDGEIVSDTEKDLIQSFAMGQNDKYTRFFLAALSSIPWCIPLFIPFSLIANLKGEIDQDKLNNAFRLILETHREKLLDLTTTTSEILTRLDGFGEEVRKRIESPEYLTLVRGAFRVWDQSDTAEKRLMVKKLLIASGAITLCPDGQIRLFIDWIERYHEDHFAVLREVYQHGPITKRQIWDNLHPGQTERPQDNSAQAGLFGYLNRELNMGGIIHLNRETDGAGQTIRAPRQSSSRSVNGTLESPFDDTKEWILSELGKEFVRYVMDDVDPQLETRSNTE